MSNVASVQYISFLCLWVFCRYMLRISKKCMLLVQLWALLLDLLFLPAIYLLPNRMLEDLLSVLIKPDILRVQKKMSWKKPAMYNDSGSRLFQSCILSFSEAFYPAGRISQWVLWLKQVWLLVSPFFAFHLHPLGWILGISCIRRKNSHKSRGTQFLPFDPVAPSWIKFSKAVDSCKERGKDSKIALCGQHSTQST